MLHKFFWLPVFCLSVGCMKVKKKEGQTPDSFTVVEESRPQSLAVIKQLDYDYEVFERGQKIIFQIPNFWPKQLVVEKTAGSEKSFQREISIETSLWKDDLALNMKTSYKFYEATSHGLNLIEQLDVFPLTDLSLDKDFRIEDLVGSTQFMKKLQFRNLELKDGAKFFISDFKGKIKIENLQSEKGSLQTFPNASRAKQGDGRSVGGFDLLIQNGDGELEVNLFAEAGANGLNGPPPDAALMGAPGAEGQPAVFGESWGSGCIGGSGNVCINDTYYKCTKPPQPGADGGQGKRGYQGRPGANGGSVKKIAIENLSSSLKINIYKREGKKGLGGAGGEGGRPGVPGQGGDGDWRDFLRFKKLNPDLPFSRAGLMMVKIISCPAAAPGRNGAQGPFGLPGADGNDGVIF